MKAVAEWWLQAWFWKSITGAAAHRLALWALKVRHLLTLRLCEVDAFWVVPALQ